MRGVISLLLALFASSAIGQAWPSKPIRWIVPWSPGGANDISARSVAERLSASLGQPVIVDNRPGAGGNIGFEMGAKSAPDGYTMLSASDTMTIAPRLYPKLGFDPVRDFAAVTQLARQPVVLAAHPSLRVNSIAELVTLAKHEPGIGCATAGAGNQQHVAAEWFANLAGIKLTHVPYKGGGPAATDLLGGQVPIALLGAAPLIQHHKSGRLKLLAQTTVRRSPLLPDVPTFEEAGLKVEVEQWLGVFVPAKTPENIVARMHAEIAKALADAGVRERFAQNGLEAVGNTPRQLAALVRSDLEKYGRLVRDLHIRLD